MSKKEREKNSVERGLGKYLLSGFHTLQSKPYLNQVKLWISWLKVDYVLEVRRANNADIAERAEAVKKREERERLSLVPTKGGPSNDSGTTET